MFDSVNLPHFLGDRNPVFLYLAIIPVIALVLNLIIGTIIMMAFKLEKSWIFALVAEIVYNAILAVGLTGIIALLTNNIFFATAIAVFYIGYIQFHKMFIQHKLQSSMLLRLPMMNIKGAIVEKHIHTKYLKMRWFREWVCLHTADNKLIKAYITDVGEKDERHHLQSFNVGDTGTLHYRKGKKHCYFDAFWPESDDIDSEQSGD